MMGTAWLRRLSRKLSAIVLVAVVIPVWSSNQTVVEAGAILPHFEDGFESGDLTSAANGFAWTTSHNAEVSTDIAHTGQYSLKFHYAGDPEVNPSAYQKFDLGAAQRSIWMEYWIYYPDGTEGLGAAYTHRVPSSGSSEQRFVELTGDDTAMRLGIRSTTNSTLYSNGEDKFYAAWSDKTTGSGRSGQGANALQPALNDDWLGRWVPFKLQFNISEIESDSTLNLWVDGNLVMENTALNAGHPTAEELFTQGTLLGQAYSGFDADTNLYIDDFKVYTHDPNQDPSLQHTPTAAFHSLPKDNFLTGENIQFRDDSEDIDGQISGWAWNFGDSTTSTAENPAHIYSAAGTYTVSLAVTDNEQLTSASVQREITVRSLEDSESSDVYFQDDFETGDSSTIMDGFGWQNGDDGLGYLGPNVEISDDIAHSGDYSMRFTFVGKPSGEDSMAEQRFDFGEDLDEVWFQWYQYYPDGNELQNIGTDLGPRWYHRDDPIGTDNNKLFRLGTRDNNNLINSIFGYSTDPVGDGDSTVGMKFRSDGKAIGEYGRSSINGGILQDESTRGRWVEYVMHYKTASGWQQGDGVSEMWVDGMQIHDHHDLNAWPTTNAADTALNILNHGYIMGWSNSGFDETSYTYMDDFTISATPPAFLAQQGTDPDPDPDPDPPMSWFADDFETGDLTHANSNFEWANSENAEVSGDMVHSGDYALKFHFAGDPVVNPGAAQHFDLAEGQTELWTEYYVYFPDGTEGVGPSFQHRYPGSNANQQVIFELDGPANNQMKMGIRASTNSVLDGDNKYYPIWSRKDTGTVMSGQGANQLNPALTDAWRGRWVQLRMHYAVSASTSDSSVQLWADGSLVMDNTTLNGGYPDSEQELFTSGFLFGSAREGFAADTYVYVDDFKITNVDPGWTS
ncbi:heparin lyase I family protein [Paenibacillus sp. HB172176]|uniref:heparin lyase I family protein n=1 Tax=Paenibacillus sp. HB172176 TaxID=2493690 RepID=UPI00143A3809|nr:heparin lyase I family protein [Paenibacillus sp. HB172176]